MKISSSRNMFDLLYLDILENSMENILSLNCGEKCRSLTCFLQHSPSRQTSIQSSPANNAECFSKFLKLCFVETFCDYVGSLLLCLGRHHYDLTLKDIFFGILLASEDPPSTAWARRFLVLPLLLIDTLLRYWIMPQLVVSYCTII